MLSVSDVMLIADKGTTWLADILGRSKNKKEQTAAKILKSAGVLVAAMRALDDTTKKIFRELKFTVLDDLSQDERRQVVTKINNFATDEPLLGTIRGQFQELKQFESDDKDTADAIGCILASAWSVLVALNDTGATPFPSPEALENFLTRLRGELSPSDRENIRAECQKIVDLYDRKLVSDAEYSFGHIRGVVMKRFPDLPYPEWARAVQ